MLHALVNPDNSISFVYPQNEEDLPITKPGWRWLPVNSVNSPDFNKNTHKLFLDYECIDNEVYESWELIPLSSGEVYSEKISEGFLVEPEGFTLRLEKEDRDAFTSMVVLIQLGLSLGLINNEDIQTIKDSNEGIQSITTARFIEIMLHYGSYYKSLWNNI